MEFIVGYAIVAAVTAAFCDIITPKESEKSEKSEKS